MPGIPAFSKTQQYSYNANGDVASYTSGEGQLYRYSYNKNQQITQVLIDGLGMVNWYDYQWQQPQEQQLPVNRILMQYDGLQRLTQNTLVDVADDTRAQANYQYDGESNITWISTVDHIQTPADYQYGYDHAYRLAQISSPLENTHYQYDKVGNRLQASTDQQTVQATYNHKNQLTAYGKASYQYDANGNTTERVDLYQNQLRKTTYHYNPEQRLTEVKQTTATAESLNLSDTELQAKTAEELHALAENLSTQTLARYRYNPYGQRISKTTAAGTVLYLYSEQGLAAEYTADGNLMVEYHYRPGSPWMTHPITQKRDGQVYYYQNDHLGTPQRVLENSGRLLWEARQTAFGQTTVTTELIENNLRFPGQYYDAETDTHYNYHRDYDPSLGRYLQKDPIGLEGGINTYAYVGGNPLKYFDSQGLSWTCFYEISSGHIGCYDDETDEKTYEDKKCYSGYGEDKNKKESQFKENKGPLPEGAWRVGGVYDSRKTGPFTVVISPDDSSNKVYSGSRKLETFRLHGDNGRGTASEGCLICSRATREAIYKNDGGGALIIAY